MNTETTSAERENAQWQRLEASLDDLGKDIAIVVAERDALAAQVARLSEALTDALCGCEAGVYWCRLHGPEEGFAKRDYGEAWARITANARAALAQHGAAEAES